MITLRGKYIVNTTFEGTKVPSYEGTKVLKYSQG
jgi:hypothetical protein